METGKRVEEIATMSSCDDLIGILQIIKRPARNDKNDTSLENGEINGDAQGFRYAKFGLS